MCNMHSVFDKTIQQAATQTRANYVTRPVKFKMGRVAQERTTKIGTRTDITKYRLWSTIKWVLKPIHTYNCSDKRDVIPFTLVTRDYTSWLDLANIFCSDQNTLNQFRIRRNCRKCERAFIHNTFVRCDCQLVKEGNVVQRKPRASG